MSGGYRDAPFEPSGVVTLLTDFGLDDPFVGVMKGVILRRFAGARIVDLCHGVEPQRIVEGAFWLERSFEWFPPGTVHLAVVDPGVGGARQAVAATAGGHCFVGPDNGLLGPALARAGPAEARAIDLGVLGVPAPSATFHGRDVFAPTAADIASGRIPFSSIGPQTELATRPALLVPTVTEAGVEGAVVTFDRFGNVVTNVELPPIAAFREPTAVVGGRDVPFVRTYSDAPLGGFAAMIGSLGTVEIARNGGSARDSLGVAKGATVIVRDALGRR